MSDELTPVNLKIDAGTYSIETKLDVVAKYLQLGNMRLVSELTGIKYDTLLGWKKSKWFLELSEEIRNSRKTKTNNKANTLIDLSLDTILDRLENGDWVINQKTGELIRKPVSIREASTIARDLRTQQIKIDELEARITHENDTVEGTLRTLAKEFAKWSKKPLPADVVDVETVEIKDT